jgi:hypothetical protein
MKGTSMRTELVQRIESFVEGLVTEGEELLKTQFQDGLEQWWVDGERFYMFSGRCRTLLHMIADQAAPWRDMLIPEDEVNYLASALRMLGAIRAIRDALKQGLLLKIEDLVHADMFADFLGMAEYLLQEGYKDPAAVIVGGVLEERLRKLCEKNGIPTADADGKPKRASSLNDELAKAKVYDKLEQKSVTAWLDLRNKAAHGRYGDYDRSQVQELLSGVRNFLTRCRA